MAMGRYSGAYETKLRGSATAAWKQGIRGVGLGILVSVPQPGTIPILSFQECDAFYLEMVMTRSQDNPSQRM